MKHKKLLLVAAALLAVAPLFAVLNEKNLGETLKVLRYELRAAYQAMEAHSSRVRGNGERQHSRLVHMMQRSNELSLMLYSQKQDYTFDMTYALNEVSKSYNEIASDRLPFDDIITRLDIDIDRYDRLVHTLRSLPPSPVVEYVDSLGNVVVMQTGGQHLGHVPGDEAHEEGPDHHGRLFELDSLGREDRDSCLFYAEALLMASRNQKEILVRDSTHYSETAALLKSAYDYAQVRYKTVQNRIFIEGQTPYHRILKEFDRHWKQASRDAKDKYSPSVLNGVQSQWRGMIVVGFSGFVLLYLVISVLLGVVIVAVLTRKVKFFMRPRFTRHKMSMVTIVAMTIFTVSILIGSAFSNQNFFSMASRLLVEFTWMLAAVLVSLVIRFKEENKIRRGVLLYLPVMLMCLLIITLRIMFVPNSLLNIVFPPVLLLFTVYQLVALLRSRKGVPRMDVLFGWISLVAMIAATIITFRGFVLMGIQLLIWWIFLLTLLQTVTALTELVGRYYRKHRDALRDRYREAHPNLKSRTDEDLITVTWPFSLMKKVVLPVAYVLSLPLSIYMASGVFDLTDVFWKYYAYPFLNVEGYISLSFSKIVIVVVLGFIFNYIIYVAKAYYRLLKTRSVIKNRSIKILHENEVNFTLVENIISISLWGIYIITLFILLKIPTAAVKVVAAGLATGLGFAMKDILNNFFYGVQLMSGRLRVGDFIECDGIRGKVTNISYQSTQIVSTDGAQMTFPNAELFTKNFKNLTRNNSYELLTFEVGVKYGSDIAKVRSIVLEALAPLQARDSYGREIVDSKFGTQVRFMDFGDNSVNLQIIQYTTVEEHFTYAARAKEAVYNALNAAGIEIPFPQQDLYIKEIPSKEGTE